MMENVETELKKFVLKNVVFKIDNKILKSGKIKIFNTKQFFIKFKLLSNNLEKEYELPYPYSLKKVPGGLLFDYTLSAFCPFKDETYYKLLLCDKSNASKLHNKYLMILQNED
jgi:hypothetical protein